jgi:beta-ribofuranosylaminobenzene 5'-phosphate synthase
LCRIALMDLLPAIADVNIAAASTALTEYGRVSGEYFSAVQGGVFADDRMAEIARRVTRRGRGFVQTSWGPTCAALCASDDELSDLRHELESADTGSLIMTAARPLNHGASVTGSPAG